MKKQKLKTQEDVEKWYAEELKRKDEQIDKLKRENAAILQTALNQGVKLTNFEQRLKELTKKKK